MVNFDPLGNGPEDESGAAAKVHTYHAIKRALALMANEF